MCVCVVCVAPLAAPTADRSQHPPDEEPVDKLLLFFEVPGPVSLDVPVELILQSVAVVFRIHFTDLKQRVDPAVNKHKEEKRLQQ